MINTTTMKRNIQVVLPFIFLFTLIQVSFSQSNVDQKDSKEISGTINYLDEPVVDVNIRVKGTTKGTRSNANGEYVISAKIGDIIEYSHVRYQSVHIVVEDVTSVLNLDLTEKVNLLDEAVVTARPAAMSVTEFEKKMAVELRTSFGLFRPNAVATKVHYMSGEQLGTHYQSLSQALAGKFSGVLPTSYDVDGLLYTDDEFINIAIIKDIYITKSIIVIRTMNSPEEIKAEQERKAEQYRNQNYYQADASNSTEESTFSSTSLTKVINGTVTHQNTPLENANIIVQGTSKGTKTNAKGQFSIEAKVGDILQFSYVGLKTVSVIIEDVTAILNIELDTDVNQLDEAVVTARKKANSVSELEKKMDVELLTPFGTINPKTSGFDVKYLPGQEISPAGGLYSLAGKIAGLERVGNQLFLRGRPAMFMVDGIEESFSNIVDLANIEDVYVIKNRALIYIRTNSSPAVQEEIRRAKVEQYQNQNFYSADAQETVEDKTFSSSNISTTNNNVIIEKEINGKVTYLDSPIPLVNVRIVGKNSGVVTNPKGEYSITANVGEIIQFSHVSYATVSIVVEDVTEVLNIEMVLQENELDEVVINADTKLGATAERAKKADSKFNSSMGTFDPKTSGNAISYIDGNEKTAGARDILDILNGKVAGIRVNRETNEVFMRSTGSVNTDLPPIWDVDGVVVTYIPNIPPDDVEDIYLLKSLAATNRYGSQGRGGVIVVRTRTGNFSASQAGKNEKIAEQYRNQDRYNNDASQLALASLNDNPYADGLEAFNSKQKAYIHYEEKLKNSLPSYADHIAIAQKFVTYFNDLTLATDIFKQLMDTHGNNPEILKAIAYHLQTIGQKKDAIEAYERTFKLRPKYAQSYRDLANAYMENDQFKKSWRLYMSFLMQGHDLSGEGIGELIYNEMEWLYFSRNNQTEIKENFVPKSKDLFEFRNDVRMIVEWNTSEAEFDLEFVSPDLRSYVFDHSVSGNQDLITEEKQKGYSSKEFFIDEIGDGEWLVNFTYKGNKKPEPTYFKITTFYNWGKAEQSKEVSVYRFQNERNKIQLKKFQQDVLSPNN